MLEESSMERISRIRRVSLELCPRAEAPGTNLSIIGLNISLEILLEGRMTQVCPKSTSARMHNLLVINSNRHRPISLRKTKRATMFTTKPNMATTWDYKATLLTPHLYSRPTRITNSAPHRATRPRINPYLALIARFQPGFPHEEPQLQALKNSNGQQCRQDHPGTLEIKCCII